jgi:hypothetical protein
LKIFAELIKKLPERVLKKRNNEIITQYLTGATIVDTSRPCAWMTDAKIKKAGWMAVQR